MAELLKVVLKPIYLPDKYPIVKLVFAGNEEIFELTDVKTFEFLLTSKQRELEICFLNKTPKDTKVVEGKIVGDLAVIIEKIEYRNYNFLPHIDTLGTYMTKDNKHITGTYGFMAFVGTYKFNFNQPLFIISRDMAILNG